MRNVDRGSVPIPINLQTLHTNQANYQAELDYIRTGNSAKSSIYGGDDVKDSLRTLYICKCYLCGKDVSTYFEIEHFLPWHSNYPERAYDWGNLHLSCKACNTRKRKKKYKKMNATGGVECMYLLCPTVDNINNQISYNHTTSEAENLNTGNYTAQLTSDFLNEQDCKTDRINHLRTLQELLLSMEWFSSYCALRASNINSIEPIDFSIHENDSAGNLSYRILSSYLCKSAPFYTFTHTVFEDSFHLNKEVIYLFCRLWCQFKNRPCPTW
ncbi:HNH endonuclease [Aeromonas hydrophila]|uniref:HNH endonuclease n=1 Tax=Aeromonas hydrophila TaxID=644 RepID=UPI0029DB7BF1|nr:HNH endonuclease [Aeromonas hydrophila]MDX7756875.1 HNH endonuclease [Aeromonas hydrophila]